VPDRQTLEHLLTSLKPRRESEYSFVAQNTHPEGPRLYGGQVLAQALRAGTETVPEDRQVHSQHAYFLRPGDPRLPVELEVENARDGGTFSSRRVVASQQGRVILVSSLSFQIPEQGDEYEPEAPAVVGPDGLENERSRGIAEELMWPEFQITDGLDLDVRVVDPVDWRNPVPRQGILHAWMKTAAPVGDARGLHESLLAYMSDAYLVDVALMPNGRSFFQGMQTASLDHALWIHAPFRADEWLLLVADVQGVGGARGLGRGQFFTREGTLVATCMQESLQRRLQ
jgi:acyl-CoA thioesterase-2